MSITKIKKPKKPDFTYKGQSYYFSEITSIFLWDGEYEVAIAPCITNFKTEEDASDEVYDEYSVEVDEVFDWLVDHENQVLLDVVRIK